ncbi:MAG TPA: ABC transporter permease, partial [Parafilimonas sp.]|nr:ABC transporter permease [Parafilimonas sp.]
RNLMRNKGFSVINIVGLSIGMASAILIFLWIQNEVNFDRFHKNTDRLYVMYSRENNNGKLDAWGRTAALMAPTLKDEYPEVEDAVRFTTVYFLLTRGDKQFNGGGAFADPGFLSMFSFPLRDGDPQTALDGVYNIVLTKTLAEKLFGNEDPIGKTVKIDSTDLFKVTGVLNDLPNNTELNFEYLLPWSYMRKLGWEEGQTWSYTNTVTYVLLKPGASEKVFDAKVKDIVKSHVAQGEGSGREVFTQPLSREHLYSKSENGQLVAGRVQIVNLFTIIAIFILLIACINFMNLSTARSEKRAKEVGIRKVVGARKISLVVQFIGESVLFSAIAFVVALAIVQLSLKAFDQLVAAPLKIDFTNPYFWLYSVAFILVTGILAGSYPAFYLSASQPISVLKGVFKNVHALVTPRKVLVVLQFSFAVMFIICTMIVQRQIQYALNRDAGYNRNDLIFVFTQGDMNKHYDLIRHDLVADGAAVSVTKTFSPITRAWGVMTALSWQGASEEDKKTNFLQFEADANFIKTTGTKLLQGRDIDITKYPTDSSAMLLNEAAVKMMQLKDPVGTTITKDDGSVYHIIGVIKDFIIESPYDKIEPMIIQGPSRDFGVIHIRLNPANSTAADLAKAEKIFKQYNPQVPFDYVFADESYAKKFSDEQQEGTLAALFAGLTIFISCLGLFGLAAYMAESRTKEIGMRKVLGASVTNITALLSKDFIKLVLISIVIASPVAWYAMNNWLQNYNYRIQVNAWIFLEAGSLALLIAFLTVSYQAIKAAVANPVKSLRTE